MKEKEVKEVKGKKEKKGGMLILSAVVGLIIFTLILSKFTDKKIEYYVKMPNPEEAYYTKAEFDYHYNVRLDELIKAEEVDIDEEKPLNVQFIKDDLSIDDYLKTYALDKIRHNHATVSYINKEDIEWFSENGVEKKPEINKAYEEYVELLKKEQEKEDQGKNFEKFLKEKFSEDMNEELFEDIVLRDITSEMYLEDRVQVKMSDDDVREFYVENEDKFTAKKYMYYDVPFDNLEEKEEAEKKILDMFDYVVDEESFIETIKTVDERVQEKVKKDNYQDEDILRDFTNTVTINDTNNFTKEWLYSEDENGKLISPNSSAVLTSSIGEKKDKGLYRLIYFIENVEDYKEVSWNFDKIFISKDNDEEAEEKVVDILEAIDNTDKDNYDEVFDEVIKEYSEFGRSKAYDDKHRYRDIKSRVLIDEGFINILSFLEDSEELEHTTIESDEGYLVVVNRGKSIKGYEDEVEEYMLKLKEREVLKNIYKYAKDFNLVAGKDKMSYLKISLDIYKANSSIEEIINLSNEESTEEDELTEEELEDDTQIEETEAEVDDEADDEIDSEDLDQEVGSDGELNNEDVEDTNDIDGEQVEEGFEGEAEED